VVRRVGAGDHLSIFAPAPFAPDISLGEALMVPTRLYVKCALEAMRAGGVKGFAHITGGGLTENVPRALPAGLDARIDLENWKVPALFGWLARAGAIAPEEMLRTFNCGIGMVAVVAPESAGHVIDAFQTCGDKAVRLGQLVPGKDAPKVVYRGTLAL
jgi:phosphoribosylformylglycinamidine cyclo-ligase